MEKIQTKKYPNPNSKIKNPPAECPLCGEWFQHNNHMAHHLNNCPGTTLETLMDLLIRKGFKNVGRKRLCWLPPATATPRYKIQGRRAHIVVFEIVKGPVPLGKHVCHTCDVGGCCNPRHLWAGTHQDNMRDRTRKGRHNMGPSRALIFVPVVCSDCGRRIGSKAAMAMHEKACGKDTEHNRRHGYKIAR